MIPKHFPNRVRAAFTASSTDWQLIGSDGTGYASYDALIAAQAEPFPGSVSQFPTGCPHVDITIDNASEAAGDAFSVVTNLRSTPTLADEFVNQYDDRGFEGIDVKLVWIKKKTAGNRVFLVGYY